MDKVTAGMTIPVPDKAFLPLSMVYSETYVKPINSSILIQ